MLKTFIAAGLLALSAAAAHAEIISYDCEVTGGEKRGWISDRVILSVDTATGSAKVLDGLINHYYGEAQDGKVKSKSNGSYRVSWGVLATDARPNAVRVNYEATIFPKTNKVEISARFPMVNATNRPRGKGNCKLISGKSLF